MTQAKENINPNYDNPEGARYLALDYGKIAITPIQVVQSCLDSFDPDLLMLEHGRGIPSWVYAFNDSKKKNGWTFDIDTNKFIERFKAVYDLSYYDEKFFIGEDEISEDGVRHLIYKRVQLLFYRRIDRVINELISNLKDSYSQTERAMPAPEEYELHYKNGYTLINYEGQRELVTSQEIVKNLYRFPVALNVDATCPRFLEVLHALIPDDAISTFQQFVGLCLVPTTKAQAALFIRGFGGEGKGVIGTVLKSLFGKLCVSDTSKGLFDPRYRFTIPDIRGKFLWLDTDLSSMEIGDSEAFKKLVSGESFSMDRKLKNAVVIDHPSTRLIVLANQINFKEEEMNDAITRRILLIDCKPSAIKVPDRFLADKIIQDELEGVFFWAWSGLAQLVANGMNFDTSYSIAQSKKEMVTDTSSIIAFLNDREWIQPSINKESHATMRQLYEMYLQWCNVNTIDPEGATKFSRKMRQVAAKMGFVYTTNISNGSTHVRGYEYIKVCRNARYHTDTGEIHTQESM